MTLPKWVALGACACLATAVSSAQQSFPLRSGEWEARISSVGSKDAPMVLRLCLNDELWQKALAQNPSCSVQQLTFSSRGATYSMDCPMAAFQMKGKVDVSFDGKEHMTARSSMDMTFNGSDTHLVSLLDYRYKGPTCSPNDVNMRQESPH
jgi:hypothetical protein